MAMTKAEKAEMGALREARDMARSLRWPEYPEPEPMSGDFIKANQTFKMTKQRYGADQYACVGWVANEGSTYGGPSVNKHFSNGVYNTNDPSGQSWSQNAGRMYHSPLEALQKLRLDVTAAYAARLAKIDAMISEADGPALSSIKEVGK